jgi:hypothetical protein
METLPSVIDLYSGNIIAKKEDVRLFTALLNEQPKNEWVVEHSFIKQEVTINGVKQKVPYKYIPIGTVEYLLKSIFGQYKIEITGQGTAFNGVWVTVRVHYFNPISNEWSYHDGIGSAQLQTKSGTSPADLQNINNGAIAMAFPNAKSIAIKDACDHFGRLFGSDLNRKDYVEYETSETIVKFERGHVNWQKAILAFATGKIAIDKIEAKYKNFTELGKEQFNEDVIKYKTDNGII